MAREIHAEFGWGRKSQIQSVTAAKARPGLMLAAADSPITLTT